MSTEQLPATLTPSLRDLPRVMAPLFQKVPPFRETTIQPSADGSNLNLVVLLRPFGDNAESLRHVLDATREYLPNAAILQPELDMRSFSFQRLEEMTAHVLCQIDSALDLSARRGTSFEKIYLIGHSLGGIIARKVYVAACGEVPAPAVDKPTPAPMEPELTKVGVSKSRDWAIKVHRLVLLAPINRGWSLSRHLTRKTHYQLGFGILIGNIVGKIRGRLPMIFGARFGAPYLMNLRAQWHFMRRRAASRPDCAGGVEVVQLLGTVDDLVPPADNLDRFVADDRYFYLEVPRTGHYTIGQMSGADENSRCRRELFKLALVGSIEDIQHKQPILGDEFENSQPRGDVDDVAFVIHGIRDEGYWTQHIATRIAQFARESGGGRKFAAETSSYGYFPMGAFAVPGMRRHKVAWLMEQYLENLCRYPNARFHYVGHSNGTYLLARALRDYPCVSFDHVVFAGSVVESDYPWQRWIEEKRVRSVLNYVATHDVVVAIFPKALGRLGDDLGSAGHDGFWMLKNPANGHEVRYVKGGHGAALDEGCWDQIASFVVNGPASVNTFRSLEEPRCGFMPRLATLCGRYPVVTTLLVLALAVTLCVVAWMVPGEIFDRIPQLRFYASMEAHTQILALVACLTGLWKVLTKV